MTKAEKLAFVSQALGGAARLAGRVATAPARGAGKVYWRAAQNAPGSTAIGTALTLGTAPMMLSQSSAPEVAQQKFVDKLRHRSLAARAGGIGMKTASVHFEEEDVLRAVRLRRRLEKTAAVRKVKAVLGNPSDLFAAGLMLGAGAGVASAGTAAASYGAGRLSEAAHGLGRDKRYAQMLKADPSLRKDPNARAYFNILDKASPYIAGEPLVAASAVRTMLESPEGYGAAPRMMKDILGVEESRQKTRFPGLRTPTFKAELPDMD